MLMLGQQYKLHSIEYNTTVKDLLISEKIRQVLLATYFKC